MKLTTKQQELLTLVENAVADTDAEQYKKHRCLYVVTNKDELQWSEHYDPVYFSTRIVKALFELGLVEYSYETPQFPKNVFRKKDRTHNLVPTGFVHPTFGWKVGDIGVCQFTCGSNQIESCYGVCVSINQGMLTFRPLNFLNSKTWTSVASSAYKATLEEALEHIKQVASEIPEKDFYMR